MNKHIYIEGDNLIISTPLKSQRSNPWDDDWHEEMDNIVGVIAGDEVGFAHWIDMSYKGKGDQISTMFYTSFMQPDEFKSLCKELGIEVEEYPVCSKCHKVIYGVHSWDDGPVCMDCVDKEEKK